MNYSIHSAPSSSPRDCRPEFPAWFLEAGSCHNSQRFLRKIASGPKILRIGIFDVVERYVEDGWLVWLAIPLSQGLPLCVASRAPSGDGVPEG